MPKLFLNKERKLFIVASLAIFFLFTIFLIVSGYFDIGLLSDDYLNFISAQSSTFAEKFTSSIPYYTPFHFRPLWFLSINNSIWLNQLFTADKANFILFRVENLFYFYVLLFLSAALFYKITKRFYFAIFYLLLCLLYPNNVNDICWTVGKVDLLCAIFIFSSLLLTFLHLDKRSRLKEFFACLFFVLALLTKETAIILPFVTILIVYISSGKEKVYDIKSLFKIEFLILLMYFLYRVYILGIKPDELTKNLQRPGFFTTIGVSFKAFTSLIIPFDYLSIQKYLSDFNLGFTIYMIVIVTLLVSVLFIFVRTNNYRYVFYLFIIFFISIVPNIIGGYFRPQLTLIPFFIFVFSLFLIATKISINYRFFQILIFLVIVLCSRITFGVIQDWNYAYRKSLSSINSLLAKNIDNTKRNIIVGLPSRFRQAYMLDYASGAYNYWKYGEFRFKDTIVDIVMQGALDINSLNSEIVIKELSEKDYEIYATGETQYFMRLDGGGPKYKDRDVSIRFYEKNIFRKPTIINLKLLSEKANVYIAWNDEIVKLNK